MKGFIVKLTRTVLILKSPIDIHKRARHELNRVDGTQPDSAVDSGILFSR